MEVCADSVRSAIEAEKGGAIRIELSANLMEGGTTPSIGMLRVIKEECSLPVFVLIRPRGGDFLYSDLEMEVMRHDIKLVKEHGADGIALGVLTRSGEIDEVRCKELLDLCRPLPVTFHRAFDMCHDPIASLDTLISLGFQRVLTSGQDTSALEGLPVIEKLVMHAKDRIIVMPGLWAVTNEMVLQVTQSPEEPFQEPLTQGGGITERNLERILKGSGAREFHCSARSPQESRMVYRKSNVSMGAALKPAEFSVKFADAGLIRRLNEIYQVCED